MNSSVTVRASKKEPSDVDVDAYTYLSHLYPLLLLHMADHKRTRSSRSTLEDANEEHRLWKEICLALMEFDRIQKRIAFVLREINTILSTTDFDQGKCYLWCFTDRLDIMGIYANRDLDDIFLYRYPCQLGGSAETVLCRRHRAVNEGTQVRYHPLLFQWQYWDGK